MKNLLKEYGENVTMGDVLLTPTKIYVKPILKVLEKFNVNGMAHITGGGLFENLPRCMGKIYLQLYLKIR